MGFMKTIRSFSFGYSSITGILLSMKIGEEYKDEKPSSDVKTLLNSVKGAFLSRM